MQLMEANDDEALQGITNSLDISFATECGFNTLITIENRQKLLHCVWKHMNTSSVYAELIQMRDGMRQSLDFSSIMDAYPNGLYKLLVVPGASSITVSSDALTDLLSPEYSVAGSSARVIQETVYYNWCRFLEEVEDGAGVPFTLGDILAFVTGASTIPPMGFSPMPTLGFTPEKCLPYASTCGNRLTISHHSSMMNYDTFKDTFILAIQGCQGFDKV